MSLTETMLYREGSAVTCGPFHVDFIVVDDDQVKQKLSEGWYKTPQEAHEAFVAAQEEEQRKLAEIAKDDNDDGKADASADEKPKRPRRSRTDDSAEKSE